MIDLGRFRSGDSKYFELVLRAYAPLVLTVTNSFATDIDHGEDLFQEIWERVYEKRGTFNSRGSFSAWLRRVATTVCISDHRARTAREKARHELVTQSIPQGQDRKATDPLAEVERRESIATLRVAMGHLSIREREAIALRILDERSPEECAEMMGITKATVRSNIRHAIKRLRGFIEQSGSALS